MAKLTYLLEEQKAHDVTAALEGRGLGTVMPPPLPGEEGRRIVVTVDGEEARVRDLVRELAPDAEELA